MKRKIIVSMAVAVVLMFAVAFAACNKKTTDNTPTASVDVVVCDALNQPLEGAKVSLCTKNGQTATTNALGTVTLTSIKAGDHKISIEKDGYATIFTDIFVDYPEILGDVAFATHTATTVQLSKLGAVVKGKVDIFDGVSTQGLANAELKLMVSDEFLNSLYTCTSNSDGSFEFTNLPENTSYTIRGASITNNNTVYDLYYNGYNYRSGTTGYLWNEPVPLVDNLEYRAASGQFKATVATQTLANKSSSIVVDFSQPVKVSMLTDSHIYVCLDTTYSSSKSLLINKVWSNNNTKLTITPATGTWEAIHYAYLYISSSVESTTNVNLSSKSYTLYFEDTSLAIGNVGTISITDDSDMHILSSSHGRYTLKLNWTEIPGATTYFVYVMDKSNNSFVNSSSTSYYFSVNNGTVTYGLDYFLGSGIFTTGTSYEILVYAYNSTTGARSNVAASITISTIA